MQAFEGEAGVAFEHLAWFADGVFAVCDNGGGLHAGHAGNKGGGHYAILLVSEQFVGVSRLQRQRVVQDLLADLFADKKIHALSIVAKTPDEYFA